MGYMVAWPHVTSCQYPPPRNSSHSRFTNYTLAFAAASAPIVLLPLEFFAHMAWYSSAWRSPSLVDAAVQHLNLPLWRPGLSEARKDRRRMHWRKQLLSDAAWRRDCLRLHIALPQLPGVLRTDTSAESHSVNHPWVSRATFPKVRLLLWALDAGQWRV